MTHVIEGPCFSITLSCRVDQRKIEGVALFFEALFNADENLLGDSRGDKTACRHDIPVPDDGGGLLAGDDLPLSVDLGTEFLNDGVLRGRDEIPPVRKTEILIFLLAHRVPSFSSWIPKMNVTSPDKSQ